MQNKLSPKTQSFLYWIAFTCAVLVVAILYILPPIRHYNLLWLQNFDYGILYNSSALLSRFEPPFLTTRGLYAWADNQDYFQILLAPLHYLPSPHYALLTVHSLGIFSCGLFTIWFLRANRVSALLMGLTVWLSPFLLNMSTDLFHTESFATILLLGMFCAAKYGKSAYFFLLLLLALSCKEDVAVTTSWFMVLAVLWPSFFKLPRTHYLCGLVLSVGVFLINQKLLLPYFKMLSCEWMSSDFDPSHITSAPASPWFTNIYSMLFDPQFYRDRIFSSSLMVYLATLLWPVLLFARRTFPFSLLPLAPISINLLGGGYLIQGYYHYDHSTFAAVIMVVLLGFGSAPKKEIVAGTFAAITIGLHWIVPMRVPIGDLVREPFWTYGKRVETRAIELISETLPKDIVISADYTILSYLLPGRSSVYMFENPLRPDYFGIYDACDGRIGNLSKLPLADIVIMRADKDVTEFTKSILGKEYLLKTLIVGDNEFSFKVYVNRSSTRRDELDKRINELDPVLKRIRSTPILR